MVGYTFIQVWEVTISDGYITRPFGYYSSLEKAEAFLKSQKDNIYMNISDHILDAIQIGEDIWLLGANIDLDGAHQNKREKLIAAAKQKLSLEELAALLGK